LRTAAPLSEVFRRTPADASRISRELKAGRVRRLAPGLYTTNTTEPLDRLVRRLLWPIVSLELPGAVVTDRTAFEMGPTTDGSVFLTSDADRDIALPGLTVRARKGKGPLEGDTPMLGVHVASRARAYLENLLPSRARSGVARRLSRREIEDRLEADLRDRGAAYVQKIRDDARKLATPLELGEQHAQLDALIGALLGTRDAPLVSGAARARAAGKPYDARRLDLFAALHADLAKLAPGSRPDPARPGEAQVLPFFEAYFSNFIEGTEFEVDEARGIVFDGRIPEERPADAHDILGTFRVVSDPAEMATTPKTVEEMLSLLRRRHGHVMEGRPDTNPGAFKRHANRAGDTVFVSPDMVEGTIARGFDLLRALVDPFQRAVFMMFLVTEVHPFADGNGRVARIMMNAELVAAGERRILVPSVFRANYLSGLKALSQNGRTETLVRSMDFLQRYALAVDFSTYQGAKTQLEGTNAFVDSVEAEREGVRLRLP
jgi:hypothetical protein